MIKLPDALSVHMNSDRLVKNASQYKEMQWSLSDTEAAQALAVQGVLLALPLSHTTHKSFEDIRQTGIMPYATISQLRPDQGGNTRTLDESLGLDKLAFTHHGAFEKQAYGRNHIAVDAGLLLDERAIVTPIDITAIQFDLEKPYDELTDGERDTINKKYLDKMVTGVAWAEIMSRRVLRHLIDNDYEPYPLISPDTLGEVKYFGTITPDRISTVIGVEDENAMWKSMIEEFGFIPGPVYRAMDMPGGPSNSYDKLPQVIGADIETGRAMWRDVLAAAK